MCKTYYISLNTLHSHYLPFFKSILQFVAPTMTVLNSPSLYREWEGRRIKLKFLPPLDGIDRLEFDILSARTSLHAPPRTSCTYYSIKLN